MKKLVFIAALFAVQISAFGQNVQFKLKNNSLLPHNLQVISYLPNETSNGTNGWFLLPQATKDVSFPVGTKLFLATRKQVRVVMSGKSIADNQPFLVVKPEDNGKVFKAFWVNDAHSTAASRGLAVVEWETFLSRNNAFISANFGRLSLDERRGRNVFVVWLVLLKNLIQ